MVKRLAIALGFVLLFAFAAQTARADEPPGAKLFATYCGACHGAGGKGGFAPAIGDEKYLSSHSDDVIARITGDGVAAKGMPAWSKAKGGTLTDAQIADIVAYLRSPASTSASTSATAPVVASGNYAQTRMTVAQSTNTEGRAVVNVVLLKSDGAPAVGMPIVFERVTMFGNMELGTVKTDTSGTASLVLDIESQVALQVDTHFKGNPSLGSSAGRIVVQSQAVSSAHGTPNLNNVRLSISDEPLLPPEGNLVTPNPPLVPTLLFVSVVLGVWSIYGYVVSQVVGIWKSKPNARQENTLTHKAH